MGVEIFSKPDCKYCTYAENMCKDLNLDYSKLLVEKDELKTLCGPRAVTYPQIKINGEHIGDYFAFQEYLEEAEPMGARLVTEPLDGDQKRTRLDHEREQ